MEKKRTNSGPLMESTSKHSIYPPDLRRTMPRYKYDGRGWWVWGIPLWGREAFPTAGVGAVSSLLIKSARGQGDDAGNGLVAVVVVGHHATAQAKRDGRSGERIVVVETPLVKRVSTHRCARLLLC